MLAQSAITTWKHGDKKINICVLTTAKIEQNGDINLKLKYN